VFARIHTLETTPEQHDEGRQIVIEQILPWLRDSSGFRGMIRFAHPDKSRTLVVTLWADEESLHASARAGDDLSKLSTAATGANRLALEDYEAEFFDVAP
jgi:heme-degrading monooxygenase HmoA